MLEVMVVVTAVLKMKVVIRINGFYCIFGGGICDVGSGSNVNRGGSGSSHISYISNIIYIIYHI